MIAPPVAQVFAAESPPLVATLMADLGDLDLAEESAQEAFFEAAKRWTDALPDRPGAWLVTTARRKAIDQLRRDKRYDARIEDLAQTLARQDNSHDQEPTNSESDSQLAMIMGCCHRSLDQQTQTALTLRYVAGLSTAQIASSFLVPEATMAKRLVRAKAKIASAGVPFTVPQPEDVKQRLDAVLSVIYLIFSEGHTATSSASLLRGDLCDEAAWLAEHFATLVAEHPEPLGLAALIAFTDARRAARTTVDGDLVLLEDQDRSLWDREKISKGHQLLEKALLMGDIGPYQLQAGIAATHAVAETHDETDWRAIVHIYGRLYEIQPTPVIALNRAVAVSMVDGPQTGLEAMDELDDSLDSYRYFHAARADLLRRLGSSSDAKVAYERALGLTDNEAEVRFLKGRINSLS